MSLKCGVLQTLQNSRQARVLEKSTQEVFDVVEMNRAALFSSELAFSKKRCNMDYVRTKQLWERRHLGH